jgi:hypothetical protein
MTTITKTATTTKTTTKTTTTHHFCYEYHRSNNNDNNNYNDYKDYNDDNDNKRRRQSNNWLCCRSGTTLAKKIIYQSIEHGKLVMTANKALLAESLDEINQLIQEKNQRNTSTHRPCGLLLSSIYFFYYRKQPTTTLLPFDQPTLLPASVSSSSSPSLCFNDL